MTEAEATAFERVGGSDGLSRIIADFVDRVFADPMIGFMFARASRDRIKQFEYQHAAEYLGAGVVYDGRDIREVHRPHKIMGGQFMRRREILRQVLERHDVPVDVQRLWLSHVDALRPLITADSGSECAR